MTEPLPVVEPTKHRNPLLQHERFNGLFSWDQESQTELHIRPSLYHPDTRYAQRRGITAQVFENLMSEVAYKREPEQTVRRVTEWVDREQIYLNPNTCPLCLGGRQVPVIYEGEKTKQRVIMFDRCPCEADRNYFRVWLNPVVMPLDHRGFTWDALLCGALRNRINVTDECFMTILAVLHAYPMYNLFLCGDKGLGKTTLFTALFDRVLTKWADTCFAMHNVVDVKNHFTTFVDDMTTQQAQVVLSSQVDSNAWVGMLGDTMGSSGMRRLIGKPRGIYINLNAQKVYVNLVRQHAKKIGDTWTLTSDITDHLISSATENEAFIAPPEPGPIDWSFTKYKEVFVPRAGKQVNNFATNTKPATTGRHISANKSRKTVHCWPSSRRKRAFCRKC